MAKASTYFGGIVNLKTGDEYDWDDASEQAVISDLSKLQGTEYGVHWEFAGTLDLEECDIYDATSHACYVGVTAVADLARDLKVVY